MRYSWFFVCSMIALPGPLAAEPFPMPSGVISWWDGDAVSESFVFDILGYNHADRVGIAVAPGIVGSALSLDGEKTYASVSDHASLSFGNGIQDFPFTIEAWIDLDFLGEDCVIASKYSSWPNVKNQEYEFRVNIDGTITLRLYQDDGDFRIRVDSLGTIDTSWRHVAVTYDGSGTAAGILLFIDGQEQVSAVVTDHPSYQAMTDTGAPFRIGASFNTAGPGPQMVFPGSIDEVTLYGRALGPSEIQGIFEAGAEGKMKPIFIDGFESGSTSSWSSSLVLDASPTSAVRDARSNVFNGLVERGLGAESRRLGSEAVPRSGGRRDVHPLPLGRTAEVGLGHGHLL